MEVKKILWPTDFSENAAKALPYVRSLSEKYNTEIHVLYVLKEYGEWGASYGDYDTFDIDKMQVWETSMAEKMLNQICEQHLEGCPLYIRHTAVGDAAEEILKLAEKEKVDMVVMASRGSKGHFSFGSVAEKVLKCACVPVVTIPVEDEVGPSK
jgi:nucleotide-binding universal stress UspA family protein